MELPVIERKEDEKVTRDGKYRVGGGQRGRRGRGRSSNKIQKKMVKKEKRF